MHSWSEINSSQWAIQIIFPTNIFWSQGDKYVLSVLLNK